MGMQELNATQNRGAAYVCNPSTKGNSAYAGNSEAPNRTNLHLACDSVHEPEQNRIYQQENGAEFERHLLRLTARMEEILNML